MSLEKHYRVDRSHKCRYGVRDQSEARQLDSSARKSRLSGNLAVRYCLITNTINPSFGGKRIYTFAGDHGVAAEGVSAYPKEVTPQMVRNMLAGGAAVNVLGRHAGAEVFVVDMGVDDPLDGPKDC